MKLLRIESIAELRRLASAWDDLWWRSDASLPTLRAELVAQWVEHFAPEGRFVALAVESQGQLVAAMPLVAGTKAKLIKVGQLPSNCWAGSGELLVDQTADVDAALDVLLAGLGKLPWPLLWWEEIDTAAPAWKALLAKYQQRRQTVSLQHNYYVGLIDTTFPWEDYQQSWSSNHRTGVKKSLRKLQNEGEVELTTLRTFNSDRLADTLHEAFEVEDKSWKGDQGSSVLRTPGMFDFFVRQSHQLVEWGQLELVQLKFNGQPLAFEYCYLAKGVTYSHKIGYDAAFRKYGPGRLLRYLQLQEQFADPDRTLFDTMGILCETKARWCTRSYPVSRVSVSSGSLLGSGVLQAYRRLKESQSNLGEGALCPKLGAASLLEQTTSTSEDKTVVVR